MKKIISLGLTLLLFSALSALALALTNSFTVEQIAKNEHEREVALMKEIFPDSTNFEETEGAQKLLDEFENLLSISTASSDGVDGYILKVLSSGYGGNVELLIGIDSDANIVNVRAGKNSETAGIGSKVLKEEYLSKYIGASLNEDFKDNQSPVDAISGATVTSTAVKNAMLLTVQIQEKMVEYEIK